MNTRNRKAAGVTAGIAALALIGGVAAQFTTSTQSAPQSIGTGTVALTIDNVSDTVWTQDISNLAAGDSVSRFLDLRNSGSLRLANITVAQTNTLGDLIAAPSDVSVKLESCSVAWNYTDGTCAGSKANALGETSVHDWRNAYALRTFEDFGTGDSRHLKLTTTLSKNATNAVQGKTGTITYTFSGTQRTAGDFGNTSDASTPVAVPADPTVTLVDDTTALAHLNDVDELSTYTLSYTYPGGPTITNSIGYANGLPVYTDNDGNVSDGHTIYADGKTFGMYYLQRGQLYSYTLTASKNGVTSTAVSGTLSTAKDIIDSDWVYGAIPSPSVNHASGYMMADAAGNIYSFGGDANRLSMEKYSPVTNTWTTLPNMPVGHDVGNAQMGGDGKIYLIGGHPRSDTVWEAYGTRVDRFDPATGTWDQVDNAPFSHTYGSSTTDAQGNIWVFGGYNNNGDVTAVDKYDITTGKWTTVTNLPNAQGYSSATRGADGSLYLFGDGYGPNAVKAKKYNIATNTWTALPNMPVGHATGSAITDSQGRIWVIGGDSGSYMTASSVYDPSTNTWTTAHAGAPYGMATTSVFANGKIYASNSRNVSTLG